MAKNDNLTDFLVDLADAIRAKTGVSAPINPQAFSDAIAAIQTGGGGGTGGGSGRENDVIFYDHDGSVICSYSIEEAKALTELPAAPDHEGLAFLRWTHSLAYIQSNDEPLDVGAVYQSANGRAQLFITIDDRFCLDFALRLRGNGDNNGIIHWGDGETTAITEQGSSIIYEHKYAALGDYVIEIENTSDVEAAYITIGQSTTSPSSSTTFGSDGRQNIRAACLRRYVAGSNIQLGYFGLQYCVNLESAILGEQSDVKRHTFAHCYSLKSIVIPNGLGADTSTFYYDYNLEKVVLSENCGLISPSCFYNCNRLKEIIIPRGVTRILAEAFRGCSALKSIKIPENAEMNSNILNACSSLTEVRLSNVLAASSPSSLLYGCNSLKSIEIPTAFKTIPSSMFYNNWSLEEVDIPDSVTKIEGSAFYTCRGLRRVSIPDSVTELGKNVFYGCASLTEVDIPDSVAKMETNTFYGCTSLARVRLPENAALTEIGSSQFYNCPNLLRVFIPKNFVSIAANAFASCKGMIEYDFRSHETVPSLAASSAFSNIPADCKIVVPDGLYDAWIAATNWSALTANIVKASEYNG